MLGGLAGCGVAAAYGTITDLNGKCLDASGAATANGTQLIRWQCKGQANQKWILT